MALYSNATIQRFSEGAEEEFAREFPCILKRYGVALTAGTAQYTLPQDCLSIRKATWKGYKVHPISHRGFREEVGYPVGTGQPRGYIFNNVGELSIVLYPTPSASLSAVQTNLFDTSIPLQFIVEYWALPDFATYRIPAYLRQRLLKAGINAGCFPLEGRGKSNKSAVYWGKFYELLKTTYGNRLNALNTLPRRLRAGSEDSSSYRAYSKVGKLPSNFGTPVDEGY